MDDALPILDYLPASYKNRGEGDYIAFLWETFESNYLNGKYQFAVLAYHMLYMCFVYFSIWQIKHTRTIDYENAAIFLANQKLKEIDLLTATSPFAFSALQERTIFRLLRLAGCDQKQVVSFAQLVDRRNEIAHPNGNIFFNDQKSADTRISEILLQIDTIQTHMQPVIHDCLRYFLMDSWNIFEREYQDISDQIREVLIHANYLSRKDIDACFNYDIAQHVEEPQFEEIRKVFERFQVEYAV
ncbi:MAG: hypothetical protein HY050_08725 [Actinobacteria bacterium]|nr:hypothetical protein [Actinomycetota bacterium]